MDWEKFWGLFHHAWGQAKVSPEYDKSKFNEMQQMLQIMERSKNKENTRIKDFIERKKITRERRRFV